MSGTKHYLAGERPIRLITTPDGGLDCEVYDWQTGALTRDMSYLLRCMNEDDADRVSEAEFDAKVAEHRAKLTG